MSQILFRVAYRFKRPSILAYYSELAVYFEDRIGVYL